MRGQERLETRRHEARAQELTDADCLERRRTAEVTAKEAQHGTMRTGMARFPDRTPLESCAFGVQPSVDRKTGQELATGRFLAHGDHVVFLGPPGPGKTHLAIALGLQAVQQRYHTRFTSAMSLIAAWTKADAETRLEERLKQSSLPKLRIIDEIGYLPLDQPGAHVVFQLIARRDERGSIVLTSNQSFGQWEEVFGTPIIATAILDRLWPHSVVINLTGDSSRLREKQQAGFLKKPAPSLGAYPRDGDVSSIVGGPFSVILDSAGAGCARGEVAPPAPALPRPVGRSPAAPGPRRAACFPGRRRGHSTEDGTARCHPNEAYGHYTGAEPRERPGVAAVADHLRDEDRTEQQCIRLSASNR